ncbi:hypothetical protein [Xylanimonas ulmi]|uniref:hypothetical protein n=1 Tax=Xylanimonas ulmi TaxID=228973 RepID=UPI00102CEDB2|nr:hypothetical protein [Xylanibacterium ulmi]
MTAAAVALGIGPAFAQEEPPAPMAASAPTYGLVVNSIEWGGPDANPGDGVCATAESADQKPVCTLRAAIEEANALNEQAQNAPRPAITITVADSIPFGTRMQGGGLINTTDAASPRMLVEGTRTDLDRYGAYFHVSGPVTIDLGHRLVVNGAAPPGCGSGCDAHEGAAFFLNGPGIRVYNADDVLATGSSFLLGGKANDVVIDGSFSPGGPRGTVAATENFNAERFVAFLPGAQDVTVRGYDVKGYYASVAYGGLFYFAKAAADARPSQRILIEDIVVRYGGSTGAACDAKVGAGCQTRITNLKDGAKVERLTFQNMVIENLTGASTSAFKMGGASVHDLTISDNRFVTNDPSGAGIGDAFILLPYDKKLTGTTTIAGNVFTAAAGNTDVAIYANGPGDALGAAWSGISIRDNHFDGYLGVEGAIRLYQTGTATVERNTFGPGTKSRTATVDEETANTTVMFTNYDNTANQKVQTWYPEAAAAGPVHPGSLQAARPPATPQPATDPPAPTCAATATLVKPTQGEGVPGDPVTLDLYWTRERTAELYLGSVAGVRGQDGTATVEVTLPVGPVTLPDGTVVNGPVDAATGAVRGGLRVQTQVGLADADGVVRHQSSQYSRVVALTGDCAPVVSLAQADPNRESTMERDLVFRVTSTLPLDPATVSTDDFTVTETAASTGSSARVVSVTPVADSGGTQFDVVVRANNSTTVTLTLPPGKVAAPGGFANRAAATTGSTAATDSTLTYVNPLTLTPDPVVLVTGGEGGAQYTLGLRDGAPTPQHDLTFTASPDDVAAAHQVAAAPAAPVIASGQTSVAVTVTAPAGDAVDGTAVGVAHIVGSPDPHYDGLVVASASVLLYAVDPRITITKQAYRDVGDPSSPPQIVATGTEVPTGGRMPVGTPVWFVFTVTNTSTGALKTTLRDVTVTDDVLGDVGEVETLAAGHQAQFASKRHLLAAQTGSVQ